MLLLDVDKKKEIIKVLTTFYLHHHANNQGQRIDHDENFGLLMCESWPVMWDFVQHFHWCNYPPGDLVLQCHTILF